VQDPVLIALQQRIKRAFDPLNILNPGKIFPPA
jgi:FAD/FMN-containing dehydrogenase